MWSENQRHLPQPARSLWLEEQGFLNQETVLQSARLGDRNGDLADPSTATQHSAAPSVRALHEHAPIGLVLMLVGVFAYGTAPDWFALSVGLLGLAATLFADARYLRRAIARRHFRFLIDRAILLTALAVVAAIWLWRLIGSRPL